MLHFQVNNENMGPMEKFDPLEEILTFYSDPIVPNHLLLKCFEYFYIVSQFSIVNK